MCFINLNEAIKIRLQFEKKGLKLKFLKKQYVSYQIRDKMAAEIQISTDTIVVGSGPGGSTVARNLSQKSANRSQGAICM